MTPGTEGDSDVVGALRQQCWNSAVNAYGTSYIFQRRARRLGNQLQVITYVGFVAPLAIGLLALGYGLFKALSLLIAIAAGIGAVQAVVGLWAAIGGWVSSYSYATESASANESLSGAYRDIGLNPPSDIVQFRHQAEKLEVEDRARRDQDHRKGIKEVELRRGMRAALRQFQRPCAACKIVPLSMQSSDCGVCGNF